MNCNNLLQIVTQKWFVSILTFMHEHVHLEFFFILQLERTIIKRIDRSEANILWNFLLIGCESNSESISSKRFAIISSVLEEMNKVEISSKQTFDLITRTFIELPKLRVTELMHLCSYCVESLRVGDPKCTGYEFHKFAISKF